MIRGAFKNGLWKSQLPPRNAREYSARRKCDDRSPAVKFVVQRREIKNLCDKIREGFLFFTCLSRVNCALNILTTLVG